jgi:hypothetical protein
MSMKMYSNYLPISMQGAEIWTWTKRNKQITSNWEEVCCVAYCAKLKALNFVS